MHSDDESWLVATDPCAIAPYLRARRGFLVEILPAREPKQRAGSLEISVGKILVDLYGRSLWKTSAEYPCKGSLNKIFVRNILAEDLLKYLCLHLHKNSLEDPCTRSLFKVSLQKISRQDLSLPLSLQKISAQNVQKLEIRHAHETQVSFSSRLPIFFHVSAM